MTPPAWKLAFSLRRFLKQPAKKEKTAPAFGLLGGVQYSQEQETDTTINSALSLQNVTGQSMP